MIKYNEFQLKNGLRVLVNEDPTTPMATVNLLYNVGSKDENIEKTGFAHLFEHFMFEGSKNIKHFDTELQKAGGDNNAFTSMDLTNYYETLPATNIETALWLESDRMLSLDFNQQSLDTQISVVCEEFKQNYINKPYGDVWHLISDMAYTIHPYKWPTIGLKLQHIQDFTLQETKDFFYKYYRPNNAILSISGGVKTVDIEKLVKKWFGDIEAGEKIIRNYTKEPKQTEKRTKEIHANVPVNAIQKAYHMCDRFDENFYATDLLSDILGGGSSSRLHQKLVKEQNIFSSIDAFISGSIHEGLLVLEGKLNDTVSMLQAEKALLEVFTQLKEKQVEEKELKKVINKTVNYMAFSNESHSNRAFNMAYFTLIEKVHLLNEEQAYYEKVSPNQIQQVSREILREENCSTIYYNANKQ